MSGVKGRSGRKRKSMSREDAMRSLTLKLPKAVEVIAKTMDGTNKDKMKYEAACRIEDRVLGKAPISLDARVKASREYTPEELELINMTLIQQRKELNGWGERQAIPEKSSSNGDNEAEIEVI